MRNFLASLMVFGAIFATGSVAQAADRHSGVHNVQYDGCGPRCREHERWEAHRRWEHHRMEHDRYSRY
jgi:hypothetical protein